MEFVPMLLLAALVNKVMDVIKAVTNKDKNGYVTILTAWVAGIVAVLLAAQTDFEFPFGDFVLGDLNIYSQVFLGLTIASTGATLLYDVPKRLDNTVPSKSLHLLPKARIRKG